MTVERPRLTLVSSVVPSPQSTSGFSARLHHFALAASRHMQVSLVFVRRLGYDGTLDAATTPGLERVRVLDAPVAPWEEVNLRGRLLRGLVQYPFDPLPFDCYPHRWPLLRSVLAEERPDVVAFYLPVLAHLAGHAPPCAQVIGVLEEGWERLVAASLDGAERKDRWLARREATRFSRVYTRLNERASAVVAISEAERDWFTRTIEPGKITVIPNGIDLSYFSPREDAERDIDVLVVGDLRAPRNHVGAMRAWEAAAGDSWRWTFVGAADQGVAAALREGGATVAGSVDDVRPFYERARAVLVPALDGTGVKSTSIQAWAMRRPLVASTIGARGLPARGGENVLVGDAPEGLAAHLRTLLANPQMAERLADQGRLTAEQCCDLAVIARQFGDLCVQTVGGRVSPRAPDALSA
jgi:glycosyltransferase involved in cell wall biosynthesis